MPTILTGIRRRRPFVGSPQRAATVVAARPPVRPIVVAQIRRTFVGGGTVGRPTKAVAAVVAKRVPAVLVAAPRRVAPVPVRAIVGRPARIVTAPPAARPPAVLIARPPRALPVPGRGLVLRVPARVVAPAARRPPPVLVARGAFVRPLFGRVGLVPRWPRYAPPPEPGTGTPGGSFRRALPTWHRSFDRALPTWGRTWRYSPMALATEGPTLIAAESDDREYAFDLSRCPEIRGGLTIASGEVLGGSGLTIGTATVLDAVFDGIPAGEGLRVPISGGAAGTTYKLACRVTLSNGRKIVVPAKLAKVRDYDA